MTHLHQGHGRPVACGVYACSLKSAGFVAEFDRFSIRRGRVT
jgi:regulation of enolase protein 1 (concanavalin A-like superfamily)